MNPFWNRRAKKGTKKKSQSRRPARIPKPKPWIPPQPKALKQGAIKPSTSVEFQEEAKKFSENFYLGVDDGLKDAQPKKPDSGVRTEFNKIFRELSSGHRPIDIWIDFITMFACAISNAVDKSHYDEREKRYLHIINKYKKHEQNLFPKLTALTVQALEEDPEQDFLGYIYTSLGLADKTKEQVFTPYHIADLMARVTMNDISAQVQEKGFIEIDDPCCGAGVTLIAAINESHRQLEKAGLNFQNHVLVSGQDIDEVVAMMCYIQISLLGVAGYFKVGNSLTEPMADGDSTENYWFTPMYCFSPVWQYRRIFNQ